MIQRIIGLVALGTCAAIPVLAEAATVSRESGEVLVNQGGGFVALNAPAELAPGTQVMVSPGGSALIAYAGDCTLRVGSGRVWTVQSKAPCEGGKLVDLTRRMNQQTEEGGTGINGGTLLVGGLVIGGGVAAAILLSGGDDDGNNQNPPVSP
jgi:hypothetical protein